MVETRMFVRGITPNLVRGMLVSEVLGTPITVSFKVINQKIYDTLLHNINDGFIDVDVRNGHIFAVKTPERWVSVVVTEEKQEDDPLNTFLLTYVRNYGPVKLSALINKAAYLFLMRYTSIEISKRIIGNTRFRITPSGTVTLK